MLSHISFKLPLKLSQPLALPAENCLQCDIDILNSAFWIWTATLGSYGSLEHASGSICNVRTITRINAPREALSLAKASYLLLSQDINQLHSRIVRLTAQVLGTCCSSDTKGSVASGYNVHPVLLESAVQLVSGEHIMRSLKNTVPVAVTPLIV